MKIVTFVDVTDTIGVQVLGQKRQPRDTASSNPTGESGFGAAATHRTQHSRERK